MKHEHPSRRSQKADNPDDAAFDAATRLLAYESKAVPGERVLTEEERALQQQQHAERLERARRQRMLAPAGMWQAVCVLCRVLWHAVSCVVCMQCRVSCACCVCSDEEPAMEEAPGGGYAGRRKRRAAEMEAAERDEHHHTDRGGMCSMSM